MSPSRIDELRRRVQNDPASIAFAQLAEEYRRSGQTDEAVRICREGLERHPGYLSARVTLGRALLDLGQLAEARGEFEFVVAEAPENLAAVRGLAEIFHRGGQTAEALTYYQRALALARHDPEIEEIVQQLSRQIGVAASEPGGGLSFEEAHQELLSAAERVPLAPPSGVPAPVRNAAEGSTAPFDFDRLVAALGTPAAPPQLEAAVEGRVGSAPDLPDTVDLGPNPFAALEAELRAHDTAAALDAVAPSWGLASEADSGIAELATAPPTAAEGESLAGDGSVADGAVELESMASVPEVLAADEPLPVVDVVWPEAIAIPDSAVVEEGPDAAPVAPFADRADGDDTPDALASTEVPAEASDAHAEPAQPPEDVLGDLESWLNTLHDRSTE